MKIGEKRKLTIAPEIAYGARKIGDIIPANSTLIFETELVSIKGVKAGE
jgi:FK506-binding protein 2